MRSENGVTDARASNGAYGYAIRALDPLDMANNGRYMCSHTNGATMTETFRSDGDQTTPMWGISGIFMDFGYVPLICSVQPGGEVSMSGGIGFHFYRRAQFGFPIDGGHDLFHEVQIWSCAEGSGAEMRGNREVGSDSWVHVPDLANNGSKIMGSESWVLLVVSECREENAHDVNGYIPYGLQNAIISIDGGFHQNCSKVMAIASSKLPKMGSYQAILGSAGAIFPGVTGRADEDVVVVDVAAAVCGHGTIKISIVGAKFAAADPLRVVTRKCGLREVLLELEPTVCDEVRIGASRQFDYGSGLDFFFVGGCNGSGLGSLFLVRPYVDYGLKLIQRFGSQLFSARCGWLLQNGIRRWVSCLSESTDFAMWMDFHAVGGSIIPCSLDLGVVELGCPLHRACSVPADQSSRRISG